MRGATERLKAGWVKLRRVVDESTTGEKWWVGLAHLFVPLSLLRIGINLATGPGFFVLAANSFILASWAWIGYRTITEIRLRIEFRAQMAATQKAMDEANRKLQAMVTSRQQALAALPYQSMFVASAGTMAPRGLLNSLADYDLTIASFERKLSLPRRKDSKGIQACRAWRLAKDKHGYALAATAVNFVWSGPVATNAGPPDERDPQDSPGYGGLPHARADGNGFHGYKKVIAALEHPERSISFNPDPYEVDGVIYYNAPVWGAVLLYGTVIVHQAGYRAQSAMIQNISIPQETLDDHPDARDALVRRYGCDVSVFPFPIHSLKG